MRIVGLAGAWIATVFLASPAYAWNATGHRLVATIAYARLSPQARAKIDELLKKHPDYETVLAKGAPADAAGRARIAFLNASVWPDEIRSDKRFYDDTRNEAPTPQLSGFPDMRRHTNWHYFDTPYAPDGAPFELQAPPHALSELPRIIKELRQGNKRAKGKGGDEYLPFDIPWLLHIESDLHQPLHCVGRFVKSVQGSDQGGNRVYIAPNTNLHAVWDGAAGRDLTDDAIAKLATEIATAHAAPKRLNKDVRAWIDEGLLLSVREVYTFGIDNGTREKPLTLTPAYFENAKKVAYSQIALAGYRLAAILNDALK